MKKFLILVLLIAISSKNVPGQDGWFWQNPKPTGANLNGVFFITSTTGWAVGDGGVILKTTDKGLNWKLQYGNIANSLNTVFFIDESNGWIAGTGYGNSVILKTTNGGDTWKGTEFSGYRHFGSIYFSDKYNGFAAGYGLFKTSDGGESWLEIENSSFWGMKFLNKNEGWLLSDSLRHTTDAGLSWEKVESLNQNYDLYSFRKLFINEGTILLLTHENKTLTSLDSGKTWQVNDLEVSLYDAAFYKKIGIGRAANKSEFYLTEDGGISWNKIPPNSYPDYLSMDLMDSVNCCIVGNGGKIYTSSDTGKNWELKSTTDARSFTSASFIDDVNGWIVAPGKGMLKTTNSGEDWLSDTTGASLHLVPISFTDKQIGYAAGDSGKIIKTTDGGKTWKEQNSGVNFNLRTSKFINAEKGFIGGDDGVLSTTDGGNTWNYLKMATIISFSFVNSQTGWALSHSLLFKTTNGGDNWEQIPGVDFYACARSIYFVNEQVGYMCGLYYTIYKTTDGGLTWNHQFGGGSVPTPLNSVAFINENVGWVVGNGGFIYATKNGGQSWSVLSSGSITRNDLNYIAFVNNKTGWIVGKNGTILKTTTGDIIGAIAEDAQAPDKYLLLQNYPNPFNPTTTIEYSIPTLSSVTLKVYDILGREVATLINEEKPAGKYEVKFDGSGLASGVYFYRIEAGGYRECKKFLLIK